MIGVLRVSLKKFRENNYNVRLFTGFFWNLLGDSFSKVVLMITAIYIAKILGPLGFGKWGVVQSTTMMFSIMLGFGIGVTSTKFIAENRISNQKLAGKYLSLSLVFSLFIGVVLLVMMLLGAEIIALRVLKDPSLVYVIRLSSMFLLFNSLNGVLIGCLVGLERFKQIAVANFFSSFLGAGLIYYLTLNYKLSGVVWGYTIYYFTADCFLFYYLLKEAKSQELKISFRIRHIKTNFFQFFNFGLAAFISAAIGGPAVWVVYAIVANIHNGYIYIGIFNLVKILQNALIQFGSQLNNPIISLMGVNKSSRHSENMNFAIPWILITLIVFPFISFPELFTMFLKNGKYHVNDIGLITSIVAFTTYIIIFKQGFARKIISGDLMWWGVWENILWAMGILICVPLFTKMYGVLGLPYAFALVYFIDLVVILPLYYKKGLIPKTLTTFTSLGIWCIVLLNVLLNYYKVNIYLKAGIAVSTWCIQFVLIYTLFTNDVQHENNSL